MSDRNEALANAVRGFAEVAKKAQINSGPLTAGLKKRRLLARPVYLWALALVGFIGLIDAFVKILGGAQ